MIFKKKEFFLLIFLIFLQSCSGGRIGNFLESSFNDLEKISKDENLQNNLVNKKKLLKENKEINDKKNKKIKEVEKPENFIENKKDKNSEKIQILNGRYGVYLKCGKTNVSLAKDTDLEKLTIDDAVSLLEEKLKDKKGSTLKKTKISNKKTTREKKS